MKFSELKFFDQGVLVPVEGTTSEGRSVAGEGPDKAFDSDLNTVFTVDITNNALIAQFLTTQIDSYMLFVLL